MPKLEKLESTTPVYTPESGNVVTYWTTADGKPVLMAKKSDGTTIKILG